MHVGKIDMTTFLGRLRRDMRGNTLAMMAIALVPISALAGSAVDVARMYVVKVRLQQACDAGVLAGRKFMTDTESSTLDTTASARATAFFNNNFKSGWMQTNTVSFTPTKTADNQVSGVASVVVPMTVMKMFKMPDSTLTVTCEARYDVADTDVIFVLDTTGSMACAPEDSDDACNDYVGSMTATNYTRPTSTGIAGYSGTSGYGGTTAYKVPEKTGSRMAALRTAVLDFYQTVAANVDSSTHVRYGFVTYSSIVNPGQAIIDRSPSYIIGGAGNSTAVWTYQSRDVTADNSVSTGNWADTTSYTSTNCPTSTTIRNPAATAQEPYTYSLSTGQASITTYRVNGSKCQARTATVSPIFTYKPVSIDVTSFVSGNWTQEPTQVTTATSRWLGCIEERNTTAGVMSFSNGSLPADLDPDLVPNSMETSWRPSWPEVEFTRSTAASRPTSIGNNYTNYPNQVQLARQRAGKFACGKPVKRLSTMSEDDIKAFVGATDFVALGGTHHDAGMIWGTRLLSPSGIFASDTAPWAGRPAPKRIIVFLTDGDMAPSLDGYTLYGIENLDGRVTDGDTGDRKQYHNARFLAECSKAKDDLKIDVWTVAIAPSSTTELTNCASNSAQALFTTSGSGLSETFKKIAKAVAMLRVSK